MTITTIAIDCRMIGFGGIGTYISSLIPHFLVSCKCLLIGEVEKIKIWKDNPNAILCPCGVKMFSIKEMLFFPRAIAQRINECDAFYTPYCSIPFGIHIPIFATIHDVVFLDVKGLASPLGVAARKLIYKYAAWRSSTLFTVSEFSASRIRAALGVHHKDIVVAYDALPDWLNADMHFDSKANAPNRIEKKRQILFVGNIKKHKGLATLLDAFNMAQEKGLDSDLVIAGAQSGFRTSDSSILGQGQMTGKNPRVRFTGRISDEELLNLYRTSALLVQPSLYEGFGLPPLEALNLGTRALISDIPVFREIYDGFPVIYFHAGDKEDLCNKLLECMADGRLKDSGLSGGNAANKESADDWALPPLPQKYSFAQSAKVILQTIATVLHGFEKGDNF